MAEATPRQRLEDHARAWNVTIDSTRETETSLISSGTLRGAPVVLKVVKRPCRVDRFALALDRDPRRIRAWAFAQAVLSAVWSIEDGHVVDAQHAGLRLASVIRPMLISRREVS